MTVTDTAENTTRVATDATKLLTFELADELYGVDVLRVQEIRSWDQVTRIPNTPRYVLGVLNIRGTIIPIIDLRARFELADLVFSPLTVVIVLRVELQNRSRTVGLVVDAVSDVLDIDEQEIKKAPPMNSGPIDQTFVQGLATVGDRMLTMLDVDGLLRAGDIVTPEHIGD